ncbi:murein biosynthesis integral membrane protein MurJ [Glaciecola sp. MH2013]|uniref:murein biosynthesis integral membrane protein MurJ n=1 Tax=Glaciecola sp. MH2013 TaxID=2785524 RepID=UPI00189F7795|nr:murein biosynthesis integral membrane protein MurJ [Glaciecola sp. MH2013]MBF7074752.1 murein biosynthesis integral membrane protein MurJ [Glaciecola sp. MH2013]
MLKSGIVVSSMTFLSRILGLVRDVVVANFLGAGAAADVFFFANKIPNFLRRLFAEGAFAQAFVPVLTEVRAQDDPRVMQDFVAKVSGTLGAIVFITAILGVIFSPVLAAIFGGGWFVDYVNDGDKADNFVLASQMLKITFPYIFFISLAGLVGAVLNTLNQFAVAAFTPVLLNVSIIVCALFLGPMLDTPAFALAWGVFFGGIVQLGFQLPFLYRAGLLKRPRWGWKDPNVTKVRTLMIPALFGVSVSQINLLLDTLIATFLDLTGSISWLYYSDRLLEFPLGLFGIAIATVILPTLSRNHVGKDANAFKNNLDWALKIICLLGIPAAVALVLIAEPLLMVIFQRGEFSVNDARMASYSLMAYGSGLLSFMLIKIFAPAFYSRQDTKTPVKYGIITMVANMVLNLILAIPFGYVGLAMATALSGTLNALLLYIRLHRTGVYQVEMATLLFICKVACSSIAMALLLMYLNAKIDWAQLALLNRIIELLMLIGSAVLLYSLCLLFCGIRPKELLVKK